MSRRLVAEALTPAVDAADASVAYAQLERIDWLLRGRSRRLLADAVRDAEHASGGSADVAHVLRVASLQLRGQAVDATDVEGVRTAYAASAPPTPAHHFPLATTGAILAALAIAGAVALSLGGPPPAPPERVVVVPPPPALTDFSKPIARRALPAPSMDAYQTGGVPLSLPVLSDLFGRVLPRFLIVNDAIVRGAVDSENERPRLLAELHAPAVLTALGPAAASRWTDVLAGLAEVSKLKPGSPKLENAAMRFADAVGLLDDELGKAGLAYTFDADVRLRADSARTALHIYQVEEVRFVTHGEQRVRVLVVRRLDHLNVNRSVLGMQASYLRDPLILRHKLEAHAVTQILPAIDTGRPLELGDPRWNASQPGREVARVAGEVVRAELNGPLGADTVRARTIGSLLIDRDHTIEGWRRQLAGRARLARIETALVPAEIFAVVRGAIDEGSLLHAGKLDVRLADMDVEGVVARVADLLAPSVARHEAQHGVDKAREQPLAMPAVLREIVGSDEGRRAESATLELSAYLSQVASADELARITVVLLSAWCLDAERWGLAEGDVAAVLVSELARALGSPVEGPLLVDGAYDRDKIADALVVVLGHTTAEVQAAAGKAYQTLFGEPLVVLR